MNNRIKNLNLPLRQLLNKNLALGAFIENCRNLPPLKGGDGMLDENLTSFTGAFDWSRSLEGYQFWKNLNKIIKVGDYYDLD